MDKLYAISGLIFLSIFLIAFHPVIAEVTVTSGNLLWNSGTSFYVTLDHTATANRTVTVPDADFTVVGTTIAQTLTGKTIDDDDNVIQDLAVTALADGTDGELITWGADAVATTISAGSSGQILTSNGAGTAPTFQANAGGSGGASYQPYDYFIKTDGNTYTAFDNKNTEVSDNADFDTVFTALKAHANYTNNNEVFIQLGTGQFLTDTGITINRSNVTFAGFGTATWLALDVGTAEGTELITLGALPTSTTYTIQEASTGDLVITTDDSASAGNFTTDDYIILQSDKVIDNSADELQAQHAQVRNAYSGNGTIQLRGSLWEDFTTDTASPTVRLSNTLIENVVIKDVSLTDLRTSVTSAHRGYITVYFVKDIQIDNVKIEDGYYLGMSVRGSMDIRISDCNIMNIQKVVNNDIIHYGIGIGGLNYNFVISGCNFEHTRHAVYSNAGSRAEGSSGSSRGVVIDGNTSTGNSSTCYDTHGGHSQVIISNNSCEGRSSNITNDPAVAESSGITARSSSLIIGNVIKNVENRCVYLYQEAEVQITALNPDESIISNNICINMGTDGIKVENATNVIVSDNVIVNPTLHGILIENGDGTYEMDVKVSDNRIENSGADGIETTGARIDAIGNTIEITGGHGIYVNGGSSYTFDASGSIFKDNNIIRAGDQGMRFNRANAIIVDGNIIDRPATNCFAALSNADYDLSNSTVTNNICMSPDYPNIGGSASRFIYGEDIIGSYFANNQAINATTGNLAIYAFAVDSADNFFIDNTITGDFGDGMDFAVTGGGTNYCLGNRHTENGGTDFFDNNDGTCET